MEYSFGGGGFIGGLFPYSVEQSLSRNMRNAPEKLNNNKWLRVFILCLVVSISILNYKRLYVPIFNSGGLEEDHRYQVVEYLEEEGYTVAYSDFENANVMMLMAENNIIVGAIDDFSKMNCLKWMTSTDWYPPAIPLESKTAYIVTETKLEKFLFFCEENNAQVVEETKIGKYHIYGSDYNYAYID